MPAILAIDSLFHRNIRKVQRDYWLTFFAVVLPLIAITPISLSYAIASAIVYLKAWQLRFLPTSIHFACLVYALAELSSFIYLWSTWLRKRRLTEAPSLEEDVLTAIINKICSVQSDFEADGQEDEATAFRKRFTGWFFKVPFEKIKRGNVLSWLAWSAYNRQLHELREPQLQVCYTLLHIFEDRCQRQFPPGQDRKIKCLRMTLDPIPFVPRPLLFYIAVYVFNAFMRLELLEMDYTKTSLDVNNFTFEFYHKPGVRYEDEDDSPLLFIHGLGMGLAQYRSFLRHLNRAFPRREIILMAQGQTAMMPTHRNYCNPPSSQDTIAALEIIADKYNIDQKGGWTVLSHSFGTITHAWIVKHLRPEYLKRSIMVDPVCFRLWESDVCYNFLYRRPRNSVQLIISYFVGRELGNAYVLHRAFWWFENLLLAEDILDRDQPSKFIAYCGGKDEIIDSRSVAKYLRDENVEVRYFPDLAHGQVLNINTQGGAALHEMLNTLRYCRQ